MATELEAGEFGVLTAVLHLQKRNGARFKDIYKAMWGENHHSNTKLLSDLLAGLEHKGYLQRRRYRVRPIRWLLTLDGKIAIGAWPPRSTITLAKSELLVLLALQHAETCGSTEVPNIGAALPDDLQMNDAEITEVLQRLRLSGCVDGPSPWSVITKGQVALICLIGQLYTP